QRLSIQRTTYKDWGNNLILPERVLVSKGSESLKPRIEYKRYDSYGNPLEVKKTDGASIVYLWGYSGQYPIAKIENATYQEVATALNTSITGLNAYTEANLGAINSLRGKLLNAQVTTYTYDPLVGISTITDTRGVKTSYEY
ncbi:sugar-binding protein, partial [Joostella sp. CR20]